VLAALWLTALVAPPAPTQAADAGIATERKWRPTPPAPQTQSDAMSAASNLFAEPKTRVLYAYTSPPGWLAAHDLDSLTPRGSGIAVAGQKTSGYADSISGTLFMGFSNRALSTSRLDQFGLRNGSAVLLGSLDTTTLLGPNQEIIGMYRAPEKPILWLYSARPLASLSGATLDVTVTELELPGNDVTRATRRWTKALSPTCQAAPHATEPIPVGFGYVPSQGALYLPCGTSGTLERNAPAMRGAARLPLGPGPTPHSSTPGDLELFPVPGNFISGDSFFDPGSGRLLFSLANSTSGSSVVVFDSVKHAYVGALATGPIGLAEMYLEPVSGRFYGVTAAPLGLLAADIRATPVRQGVNFAEFATFEDRKYTTHHLTADPITGRLFLKYQSGPDFRVARDTIPWFRPEPEEDPDRNTVDVAEDPANTSVTFAAAAQGFGSRHRQVGGLEAFSTNYLVSNVPYPVGQSTRELRTSYLNGLMAAGTEAASNVITADRDRESTEADMSHGPTGDPWPYVEAQCVDFGGESKEVTAATATASCDSAASKANAHATFDRGEIGEVAVNHSSLRATTRRDSARGALSTVTATARGITVLGNALEVGEVVATGEAVAKGRPGTAKTSWQRTVRNVKVLGETLCTTECDIEDIATAVNTRLSGRVLIEFPEPDAEARKGSPRGFQAAIRRSVFEQFEEQMLNGQPPDRIELPAMVVTVFQDNAKSGRTVNEFAAVEAEARYGISLLGDGGGPGGGSDESGGSLSGFGDVANATGDSPAFGLPPGSIVPSGVFIPGTRPATGGPFDLSSAGGILWNGLRRLLQLLPIWAVLLTPIYLSARRWLLLQRDALVPGGSS
jgi:hypothetical protein